MGSSARKKREKKKDFQKTKLKVGKAKPKADNHTDTSFRAKAIVLNQQSLTTSAPSFSTQFSHHLSLSSSKSESQRRDSLSFLTTFASSRPVNTPLPLPTSSLLPKLCPLILDGSNNVRTQLLRLLRALPEEDIRDHCPEILPYIRAGMTHLAADVRLSAVDVLSWLLDVAGDEVVNCAGGFIKTLNCFLSTLNWHSSTSGVGQPKFGKAGSEGKSMAKVLQVLGKFLAVSLGSRENQDWNYEEQPKGDYPYWHLEQHLVSARSNAYGYLNLFGPPRDNDSRIIEDLDERIDFFNSRFRSMVEGGVEQARREGGEIGRSVAGIITKLKTIKMDSQD